MAYDANELRSEKKKYQAAVDAAMGFKRKLDEAQSNTITLGDDDIALAKRLLFKYVGNQLRALKHIKDRLKSIEESL